MIMINRETFPSCVWWISADGAAEILGFKQLVISLVVYAEFFNLPLRLLLAVMTLHFHVPPAFKRAILFHSIGSPWHLQMGTS